MNSKTGTNLIFTGANEKGDGLFEIESKEGRKVINAGTGVNGFVVEGFNKTGEAVVQLSADDYGNGVVGAYNRKGKGRTLQPGP